VAARALRARPPPAIGESLTCKADEDLAVHLSIGRRSPMGRADFILERRPHERRETSARGTTFTMAGRRRLSPACTSSPLDGHRQRSRSRNPIYVSTPVGVAGGLFLVFGLARGDQCPRVKTEGLVTPVRRRGGPTRR